MTSDAKFRWFEDMNHDTEISIARRGILGYCAIRYARESEGCIIRVTQQTIAGNLGVTTKVIKGAFKSGSERGWVERVAERRRGRGHHGADTWRLRRPEIGNRNDPYYGGLIGNRNGQKWVTETSEIGNRPNAATSTNSTPKGIKKGIGKGMDPQPLSCSKHPDGPGHRENCHRCMQIRLAEERERAAAQEREQRERQEAAAERRDCDLCDEGGWLKGDDGPVEPAIKCAHKGDGRPR